MMPFAREQVMLTLAGLTYRGFADPGAADGHDGRVRAAVEAGLDEDCRYVRGLLAHSTRGQNTQDDPLEIEIHPK